MIIYCVMLCESQNLLSKMKLFQEIDHAIAAKKGRVLAKLR